MAEKNVRAGYSENIVRPTDSDMVQQNSDLDSATTQYQNANPGMSREEAFGEVTKVSPQTLKSRYNKNADGSYTIKARSK